MPLLQHVGVEFFKDAWDRGGKRGVNFQQGLRQVVHALDVSDRDPMEQIRIRGHALVHMRERQKTHGLIRGTHPVRSDRVFLVRAEIIVREHHALGLACSAGGVDDRGNLVGGHASGSEAIFGDCGVSCRGYQCFVAKDLVAEIGEGAAAQMICFTDVSRLRHSSRRRDCISPATITTSAPE